MSYFNQIKGIERGQGRDLERDIFVCFGKDEGLWAANGQNDDIGSRKTHR